jgi:hypothetical protein
VPETLGLPLRETIYHRIVETDGCYFLIYSGAAEKLKFLSSLLRESRESETTRLLIDFRIPQFAEKFKAEGYVVLDKVPETYRGESPDFYCLRKIRDEVTSFANRHIDSERILVVVDASSFFFERQEASQDDSLYFHRNIAFHKDIVNMVNSVEGATAILLYDANLLGEKLTSKLIELHQPSRGSSSRFTPKALKDEIQKRAEAGRCNPEIMISEASIMLLDPPSDSAALLLPLTKALEEVLPSDPLNIAHRDIAFTNNYTSHPGSCPYFSLEVASGCLLDPSVISTTQTRGRSFTEGRPCVTAIDHMICGEKQEKKEDDECGSKQDRENRNGTLEFMCGLADMPAASNELLPLKHPAGNHRAKTVLQSRTTRRFLV